MFGLYYGITFQLSPTKAVLFPDFFKSSKTWSDDKSVFTITFFPGRSISKLAIPSGDKTKKWTFVKSWEIFPLNVKCQCKFYKWFLLTTISWGLQRKTGLGIQSFFYCACSWPEPTDWECYNVVATSLISLGRKIANVISHVRHQLSKPSFMYCIIQGSCNTFNTFSCNVHKTDSSEWTKS